MRNKPKRIYVGGPMRGFPNLNFPKFDKLSKKLRDAGYEVINPADLDREHFGFTGNPPSMEWIMKQTGLTRNEIVRSCVKRDIEVILTLTEDDAALFMDGWDLSTGSMGEISVCKWYLVPTYGEADLYWLLDGDV